MPFDHVIGKRTVGLCSIGDPGSFISLLKGMSVDLVDTLVFPDHHQYTQNDYRNINRCIKNSEYLITTEKDIAKIDENMIEDNKLTVLEIEQTIEDEERFFQCINTLAGIPRA